MIRYEEENYADGADIVEDDNGDADDKDNDGHAILARHVWGGSRP